MFCITDKAILYDPSAIDFDGVWAVPMTFLRIVIVYEADATTTDIGIVGYHIFHDGRQLVWAIKIILYLRHVT